MEPEQKLVTMLTCALCVSVLIRKKKNKSPAWLRESFDSPTMRFTARSLLSSLRSQIRNELEYELKRASFYFSLLKQLNSVFNHAARGRLRGDCVIVKV